LGEHEGADPRIPWDVLVNLFERLPSSFQDIGDFAGVVLRVKELYEVANEWQQEISSLTMLSLRGGKRRNPTLQSPGKDEESDAKDPSSVIEMKKVAELCHHPILEKVKNLCLLGRLSVTLGLTFPSFAIGRHATGIRYPEHATKQQGI
jgi:hypothetical protein